MQGAIVRYFLGFHIYECGCIVHSWYLKKEEKREGLILVKEEKREGQVLDKRKTYLYQKNLTIILLGITKLTRFNCIYKPLLLRIRSWVSLSLSKYPVSRLPVSRLEVLKPLPRLRLQML